MENRNPHAGLQLLLDLETFGSFDIFEIDSAESRFESGNNIDHPVNIGFGHFDIEHVDTGKFLEQNSFAFHDRLGSQRANIAQTKHSRAICQDSNKILPDGIISGSAWIRGNRLARCSNTGGVSKRKIMLIAQWLGGLNFQLARCRLAMKSQSA